MATGAKRNSSAPAHHIIARNVKTPAPAVMGMPCSNHSATIIAMMITLTPRTNPHRRSSTERTSCRARGHWYEGSASMSGSGSSPRNMVWRSTTPTSRMIITEATYMRNTTRPAYFGKNAWASTRNTDRRAEHATNGTNMPVSTR